MWLDLGAKKPYHFLPNGKQLVWVQHYSPRVWAFRKPRRLLLTGRCIWVGAHRNLAVVQQLQLRFLVWNKFSNKLCRNDSFYRLNSLTIWISTDCVTNCHECSRNMVQLYRRTQALDHSLSVQIDFVTFDPSIMILQPSVTYTPQASINYTLHAYAFSISMSRLVT